MASEMPALALVFFLGLRHGLEADHLLVINGLTLNASHKGHRAAPWVGAFFAAGHGLTVTGVSLAVAYSTSAYVIPSAVLDTASYVSLLLIAGLGLANLRALLRPEGYRPQAWKQHLLPSSLRKSSNLLSVLMVGVLFALMLDTLALSALFYSMSVTSGGPSVTLWLGLTFTLGMAISETADSQLVHRALSHADPVREQKIQRAIGIVIVALSFATAGIGFAEKAGHAPQWKSPGAQGAPDSNHPPWNSLRTSRRSSLPISL